MSTDPPKRKQTFDDEIKEVVKNVRARTPFIRRICVVFPKMFEFSKFMMTLYKDVVSITEHDSWQLYGILLEDEDENLMVYCLVIDDSDINFLLKLSQFIMADDHQEEFLYLLMGTCGGVGGRTQVGDVYPITVAHKIDRGVVSEHGLVIRPDKIIKSYVKVDRILEISPNDIKQEKNIILSSNQVVEFVTPSMVENFPKVSLFDMETFDFFTICKFHGALRVVSDIIGETNQKANRLTVSFNPAKEKLRRILKITDSLSHTRLSWDNGDSRYSSIMGDVINCLRTKIDECISNDILGYEPRTFRPLPTHHDSTHRLWNYKNSLNEVFNSSI